MKKRAAPAELLQTRIDLAAKALRDAIDADVPADDRASPLSELNRLLELRDGPAQPLDIIKDVHRLGGNLLSKEELVELLKRPVWMGAPVQRRQSGAGRPSRKSQYDLAAERRKDLYRRLVTAPKARSYLRDDSIVKVWDEISATTAKQLHDELERRAQEERGPHPPDLSSLRRTLNRLGKTLTRGRPKIR